MHFKPSVNFTIEFECVWHHFTLYHYLGAFHCHSLYILVHLKSPIHFWGENPAFHLLFFSYEVFSLSDFKAYLIHKLPGQQYHTKFRKPGFRLQQSQYKIHQYNLRKFMSVIKGRFSHNTEPEKYLVIATAFFIHTYILENW